MERTMSAEENTMCEHGFIGPCAECDGAGQVPDAPGWWDCVVCGEQNSRLDGECQFCDGSEGTLEKRLMTECEYAYSLDAATATGMYDYD
jgi:hypothetical protein